MTNTGRWGEPHMGHGYFAEIALDPELHASFCRRGRRRLKEIQMSSRAQLKLDRARGVLRVGGSEEQVAEVQRQLECLGGPRKSIRNAAWAELMRTRMSDDATSSAVQRIQQLSNCRVHIERTSKEVRLFGPKTAVALASRLLDDLQQMCTETLVEFDEGVVISGDKIQQISEQQCVTIVVEEARTSSSATRATVMGFEFAVSSALKVLEAYEANTEMQIQPGISEPVLSSVADALSNLGEGHESGSSTTGSTSKVPAEEPEDGDGSSACDAGVDESGASPSFSAENSQYCSCPTCGATNFCVSCGAANEKFQFYAMSQMQAIPMGNGQMGQMMMMPNMAGGMGMQMPGQVFGVCMPMQMPMQMQQIQGTKMDANGDGQVYLVPAMMQPNMMMCGDGTNQNSFCN